MFTWYPESMSAPFALSVSALKSWQNQAFLLIHILSPRPWRLNFVTDILLIPVALLCVVSCRTMITSVVGLSELMERSLHSSCFVKYVSIVRYQVAL